MNGAFLGNHNIKGNVWIERNKIENAFNEIRMVVKQKNCQSPDCINFLNKNVTVRNNTFLYIRDNSIEPEYIVNGVWLIENNFFHSHADISLNSVHNPNQAAEFIINKNIFSKTQQPSLKSSLPSVVERHNGGKVLKLSKKPRHLPTVNGLSKVKDIPFLRINMSLNNVDLLHEEQEKPHKVSFLKGALPRGTDLTNWTGNSSNLCNPIWQKDPDGKVSKISPDKIVNFQKEIWLFEANNPPWKNKDSLLACQSILRDWGVCEKPPLALDAFYDEFLDV